MARQGDGKVEGFIPVDLGAHEGRECEDWACLVPEDEKTRILSTSRAGEGTAVCTAVVLAAGRPMEGSTSKDPHHW